MRKLILLALGVMIVVTAAAQKPRSYRLKVGDKFTTTAEITQAIEQDLMGQNQSINQTILNVDEYEVVLFEDGVYRLKSTGIRRKVEMSGATAIDMDSDLDGVANLALRALTGKSFYMKMDIYGKVLELEDFDDYKKEVGADFEGTMLESQKEPILMALNEETIKTSFEIFFHLYAPGKRKTWEDEYEMTVNNLPIAVATNYVRNGKKISATGTMALTGEVDVQGATMTADLSGTQKTDYQLDKKTGLPTLVETKQDLSGEMNIQNMTIPMTIKTISKATITW
ncbi:MAG: hypothetical protein HEP71_05555 [Roseivirga sp.]|nr:hypothetical protein [Roseivirga sp.]